MPRLKGQFKDQPEYRYHVSGQACVDFAGETFYLGKYDSPESFARYYQLIAEWKASDCSKAPDKKRHQKGEPITVATVTAQFRGRIDELYHSDYREKNKLENLCTLLEVEFGPLPVDEFRPQQFKEIRGLLVIDGCNRRYTNDQMNRVKKIFEYAAGEGDLIDEAIWARLDKVSFLREGQAVPEAGGMIPPESKETPLVDVNHVLACLPHMSPVLKAMVVLEFNTGMRPSEIFKMKPILIDRTGDEWIYRLGMKGPDGEPIETHKTQKKTRKSRVIPIVGASREALEPFMDRDANAYCFSPAESRQWWRDQASAKRTTPLNQGEFPGSRAARRKPGSKLKRQPRDQWNKDGYRQAIHLACDKAGVPHWTPYQLRHTAATEVYERCGEEAAKDLLGHTHVQTTRRYARVSEKKAMEGALGAPQIRVYNEEDGAA